jgi:hypothetical protein
MLRYSGEVLSDCGSPEGDAPLRAGRQTWPTISRPPVMSVKQQRPENSPFLGPAEPCCRMHSYRTESAVSGSIVYAWLWRDESVWSIEGWPFTGRS